MRKLKALVLKDGTVSAIDKQSKRLDEFEVLYREQDLIPPYYDFSDLAKLLERIPEHYACVRQKSLDFITNYDLIGEEGADERDKKILENFLENCNPEDSFLEILRLCVFDYVALGNAYLEVARNPLGQPTLLEHIPAENVRIQKGKKLFCQVISGKKRWFKKYGLEGDYSKDTGLPVEGLLPQDKANEIIHFKKPSLIDDYYGMPEIWTCGDELICNLKINEYNYQFFDNNAIPRYVCFIEGDDLDISELEATLKQYFTREIKGNAHTTLIIPHPSGVKITLQPLDVGLKESSFRATKKDNREAILIAHQMPPYRVGLAIQGSLGGNTAYEQNKIYKASVVTPEQEYFATKINKLLFAQGFKITSWRLKFKEIDVRDKRLQAEITRTLYQTHTSTINENRAYWGKEPKEGGDEIYVISQGEYVPLWALSAEWKKKKEEVEKKSQELQKKIIELEKKEYWRNRENQFTKILQKIFEEEEEKIIDNLFKQTVKKFIFFKTELDVEKVVFDREKEIEKIEKRLDSLLKEILAKQGGEALKDAKIDVVFDLRNPIVEEFIKKWKLRLAEEIVDTTLNNIRKEIALGVQRGYSIDQIARGVKKENYKGIRGVFKSASDKRAKMIARTEITRAQSEGRLIAWEQSGVVSRVELPHQPDECEECAMLKDREYTLDEATGLLPVHPNCRCTISPIIS